MSMDYIRRTYGVPARRGGRVRVEAYPGVRGMGTITSAPGAHLRIRFDGDAKTHHAPFHPTWNIEYL